MMSSLTLATLQSRATILADTVSPQTDVASTCSTEYVITGLDIFDSVTGIRKMIIVAGDIMVDSRSTVQKSGRS